MIVDRPCPQISKSTGKEKHTIETRPQSADEQKQLNFSHLQIIFFSKRISRGSFEAPQELVGIFFLMQHYTVILNNADFSLFKICWKWMEKQFSGMWLLQTWTNYRTNPRVLSLYGLHTLPRCRWWLRHLEQQTIAQHLQLSLLDSY